MEQKILEKLEWPLLLQQIAAYCHTEEAHERALALRPNLSHSAILSRWQRVDPLKHLIRQGYRPPIGTLSSVQGMLKAAGIGAILDGKELRAILHLLVAVKKVLTFAQDFAPRCPSLAHVKAALYPLPALVKAIERAVDEEGHLNDHASDELAQIRQEKRSLSRRIEQKLSQILRDQTWELYLQDDFYTMRNDRYVVPVKLDGRGRVSGTICDTSDSGQTLFIEPQAIAPLNQALQELELSEKLEIIRIFRTLTQKVGEEAEVLAANYEELVSLDFLSAQAQLADSCDAGIIHLHEEPLIDLRMARHPLVTSPGGGQATPNHIELHGEQRLLIISGPNAGGKTVVLKTAGMLLLMAKAGLLVPADPSSTLGLFANLYLEMGDAQSLTANLSTFSGHIAGLKPILAHAAANDLVLLDELAVGTEPQTGAAIAQAVLEHLAERQATALVTTHYDNLKSLAVNDRRFRNASMEYSLRSFKPTYRLILDVPGQSYGLEVATQTGLPTSIIARAKSLRGESVSSLDQAVSQLMVAREETERSRSEMVAASEQARSEKLRWQQEVELLQKTRQEVAAKLKAKFEKDLATHKDSLTELTTKMRETQKDAKKRQAAPWEGHEQMVAERDAAREQLKDYQHALTELSQQFQPQEIIPGRKVTPSMLHLHDRVYIVPLRKEGKVTKIAAGGSDRWEVEAGTIRLKLPLKDLRLLPAQISDKALQKKIRKRSLAASHSSEREEGRPPLVLQTTANTLDLRGQEVTEALEKTWRFIDSAVLRGESAVILVHGHGTAALKNAIRQALGENCPYDLQFQPGERSLGGDGVTVVYFGR